MYFKVDDNFQWYSDHRYISVCLRVNVPTSRQKGNSWSKMYRNKMLWNTESIDKYREVLEQPVIIERLRNFTESEFLDSDEVSECHI